MEIPLKMCPPCSLQGICVRWGAIIFHNATCHQKFIIKFISQLFAKESGNHLTLKIVDGFDHSEFPDTIFLGCLISKRLTNEPLFGYGMVLF